MHDRDTGARGRYMDEMLGPEQTHTTRWRAWKRSWPLLLSILAWAVSFGPSVLAHARNSANPLLFNDDARQWIWPFFRYFDGRFARDYIGDYYLYAFLPIGYRGVFTALAFIVDPVVTSKVVPYLLLAVTVGACALAARRVQGAGAFFGCGLLCLSSMIVFQRMVGTAPRAFGYPIAAFAMYALASGRPYLLGGTVVAGSLFYPTAAVAPGIALALWLLVLPRRDRTPAADWPLRKRLGFLVAVALLAGLAMAPTAISARRYGRIITPADARAFPEAGPAGRYGPGDRAPFGDLMPGITSKMSLALVGDGVPFVPALSVRGGPKQGRVLLAAAAIAALGIPLLWASNGAARRLTCLGAASCIGFVLARAFAPFLYIPERHLLYFVPLLTAVALPSCAAALARLLPARVRVWASQALAVLASVAVVVAVGGQIKPKGALYIDLTRNPRVFSFLAKLPPNALIAGWPLSTVMENAPYVSRRRIFLSYETHQAFHTRYVAETRKRMRAIIAATFATNYAPLVRLRDAFHVTHFVADLSYFGAKAPPYFQPFSPEILRAFVRGKREGFAIPRALADAQAYREGTLVVLDLRKLPAA